jgi:hypothetical protein
MKVYDGSTWLNAYASLSGALLATSNLSDLNNTATARTNLGVAIGTNVQAYDAQLADVAGLTPTDNGVIIGNGTNFVVESGATLKTSLGLTIGTDVQAWDADLDTWATKTAPSGTVVGTSDSQTLTNKTLTTPVISSITNTGTLTLPTSTDTLVGRATTDTLTNKTISGSSNTLSNIANASLTNSAVTIGGTSVSLGGSTSTIANDLSISGLTVGKGVGANAFATAVGFQALNATNTGSVAGFGYQSLFANTSGEDNTAVGSYRALYSNTTGSSNIAVGRQALQTNTTGSNNVAIGRDSLFSNTTGANNTAVGYFALRSTAGNTARNTAVGANSLQLNTSGEDNTALGYQAGYAITTGTNNTAIGNSTLDQTAAVTGNFNIAVGNYSLRYITSGSNNVGVGAYAVNITTTGSNNIGIGSGALGDNTTGGNNVSIGVQALADNTTASNNTAVGYQAGYTNATGVGNVFVGRAAGYTSNGSGNAYNTIVGDSAGYSLTTGTSNTFIGSSATANSSGYFVTTGSKNTIIGGYNGNQGGLDIRTASNYIVLSDGDGNPRQFFDEVGNAYFQYNGQSPTAAPSGMSITGPVNQLLQIYLLKATQVEAHIGFKSSTDTNFYVGTAGGISGVGAYGLYQQNVTNSWTSVSDERVKTELEPITDALQKVSNVRTVTGRFTYDEENGVTRRLPFLIAQDFLEALPEAVDTQNPDKLGLSYSDTVVLAFAAIKELKAEIDLLKQQINGA